MLAFLRPNVGRLQALEQNFFHATPDAVQIIEDGRFVDCNDGLLRMFGYRTRDELIGQTPDIISPPFQADGQPSGPKAQDMIQQAITKGFHRFEWLSRRADGTLFECLVTLVMSEVGGKPIVYSSVSDLTEMMQARRERDATLAELAGRFESEVTRITDSVQCSTEALGGTARALAVDAEQTKHRAQTVSGSTQHTADSVRAVAEAAEELSLSIREIGRQVEQSHLIAQLATEQADRTSATVQGLAESSSRISDILNMINAIASQTNLLALNATIEAARAGEAGKGFAVVASEVKSLANQTARATEDIRAQIAEVQSATADAVSAMRGIGERVTEINQIATVISAAVEQQSASTSSIVLSVQNAAQGAQTVSLHISGVSESANQTRSAADNVLESSSSLEVETRGLAQSVRQFVSEVKVL